MSSCELYYIAKMQRIVTSIEENIPAVGVLSGMAVGLLSKAVNLFSEMCVEVRGKPSLYDSGTSLRVINDAKHLEITTMALLVPVALMTANLVYKLCFREDAHHTLQNKGQSKNVNLTSKLVNRKEKKASICTQLSLERSRISVKNLCEIGVLTAVSIGINVLMKPFKKWIDPSGHVIMKSAATLGMYEALDYISASGQKNLAFWSAVTVALSDTILMANTVGCTHTVADLVAGTGIALGLAFTAKKVVEKAQEQIEKIQEQKELDKALKISPAKLTRAKAILNKKFGNQS